MLHRPLSGRLVPIPKIDIIPILCDFEVTQRLCVTKIPLLSNIDVKPGGNEADTAVPLTDQITRGRMSAVIIVDHNAVNPGVVDQTVDKYNGFVKGSVNLAVVDRRNCNYAVDELSNPSVQQAIFVFTLGIRIHNDCRKTDFPRGFLDPLNHLRIKIRYNIRYHYGNQVRFFDDH